MKRLTLLLAALGAMLLVSASPAMASELSFKETFGSAAQPSFTNAGGMAVDPATGDLLVINSGNQSLKRFKANGEPHNFSALGSNTIDGAGGADETPQEEILSSEFGSPVESEVAVAPPSAGATAGYIYVTDAVNLVVDVFAPSGEYKGQEEFGYPCGVAVDSTGTVFVGSFEGNAAVYKMTATAAGELNEVAQFPTTTPCQVAAGAGPSAGYVFAAKFNGAVTKLNATTGKAEYVVYPGTAKTISVDSGSGYLYAAAGPEAVIAFDASGAGEATEVTKTVSQSLGVAADGSTHDVYVTEGEGKKVSVYSQPVKGPLLTIAKTGEGAVTSSPKGIECTGAKTGAECSAEYALNSTVTLTASPASGYAFSAWAGCTTHVGLTCTVEMSKAKTVKVTFVATPSFTVKKTGTGQGKVGATGISCDENCSEASSAIKTGTSVTVKVTPAKGSEAAVFEGGTGSASSCSGGTCTFTISENSSVKVKFAAIPTSTLTVKLIGPAAYKGKVTGKGTIKGLTGAAINCGSGCTSQRESFFTTDEVELSAVAGTGYTFAGWSTQFPGEGGTCKGTTTPCKAPMATTATLQAKFE